MIHGHRFVLAALCAAALATGCDTDDRGSTREQPTAAGQASTAEDGRLLARPRSVHRPSPWRGRVSLGQRALLYVPSSYRPGQPNAFVLALHGAGSGPGGFVGLGSYAERAGVIVLAPKSLQGSWDLVRGGYGPDVAVIDHLLRRVFARLSIDPRRVFVWGFSDGASYALSLGVANGDLFDGIVALSPGFAAPEAERGRPRIFIAHGTRDTVLPIDRTSRRLVADFRGDGYRVTFRTFKGPHTLWQPTVRQAVAWLARGS